MRTLILGFLQQKSDRQPFFDYVASEAEKMTQEEFEDLKGRIFHDLEAVKNIHRHPLPPRRSATVTKEFQKVGILPPATQQPSSFTQAAAAGGSSSSSYVYCLGNPQSVLTLQEASRHVSGILSQLPDLTTQIIDQLQQQQQQQQQLLQQQLFTITTTAPPQQQQPPH